VQITDFNPGVRQNGLFWTTVVDARDVTVDEAAGTATLRSRNVHMKDFHDFENAMLRNGAPPTPANVSFTATWTATDVATTYTDAALRYRGELRPATAQMEWTARAGGFDYTSAPLATSTTDLAWLGTERNGSFF
jgi:hypothetical protein